MHLYALTTAVVAIGAAGVCKGAALIGDERTKRTEAAVYSQPKQGITRE